MGPMSSVVFLLACAVTSQAGTSGDCPRSFKYLLDLYNSCAPNQWSYGPDSAVPLRDLRQVTGGDVVAHFERICSFRPNMTRCKDTALGNCPGTLRQTYQNAVEKSLSFCDANGNIRGSVTRALIGTSEVPEAEKNKSLCLDVRSLDTCPHTILSQDEFANVRDYQNFISRDAGEVLNEARNLRYFSQLFDCYYRKIEVKCPHNTIPMLLAGMSHLVAPPKFGINISDIIITKATEDEVLMI